ncbi:endonuclease domain-containing protein [Kitasatospora purpeofusca]|uniref:endonuclease domain-containing protein n=1 Tax=Kitasatospora purpeofusca TaxID=67352 RepID=UPI003F4A8EEB
MDYRRMSSKAKALFLEERPWCALCGARSMEVDHDHASGEVRGALCRVCNGRLGSLEAALRLPVGEFQAKAGDLHRALWCDGRVELGRYTEDFAYLGLSVKGYERRLREVHDLLVLPFVYWTPVTGETISRATQWSKIGPLCDDEEARRHQARLVMAPGPPFLRVWVTREPDDGVNSPRPRALRVEAACTEGAREAGDALRRPVDMSRYEAKCRDFVDLVVPVLLSRPLTVEDFLAAHWNSEEEVPKTPDKLRELIGDKYSSRWLDLAVRMALEDLGDDLPDRRWALFNVARWHWLELFAYWCDRRAVRPVG